MDKFIACGYAVCGMIMGVSAATINWLGFGKFHAGEAVFVGTFWPLAVPITVCHIRWLASRDKS